MTKEESNEQTPKSLVVIGSSAGGIEALAVLVSTLSPDFPAPIVLAQHLDPNRPSTLGDILERHSTLPVVVVTDSCKLEAGTVYVVPSNRHVGIHDHDVVLEGDHASRPKPSVDLLLSTAAEFYREHLIAVILTGSGSDGAAGAVDVKEAGGIVVIQDPATARYPSMPLALPPTAVDYAVELEQIGPLLSEILKTSHLREATAKVEHPLRDLLNLVAHHSSIDFQHYKPTTILRRVSRRMVSTHNATIEEYTDYIAHHSDEMQILVSSFLIKVTEFFRDAEAFAYLKESVLPLLIERGKKHGRTLRLWSAGCASGEEPYSLAMLVADLLGPDLPLWSIKIFATDFDEAGINFARRGLYPESVLRKLPDDYRSRFFDDTRQGYRINKDLRQFLIFGQQDITRGVPFPNIDMVVCRNLLIYFKPELQHNVLDTFAYSLNRTHGYLLLGQAETARPSQVNFEVLSKKWKVYRCVDGPLTTVSRSLPRLFSNAADVADNTARPQPGNVANAKEPQTAMVGDDGMAQHRRFTQGMGAVPLRHFNETVFRSLPVGISVVNRQYKISTINSAARKLLGVHTAVHDQDFLHTARSLPYDEIRSAIDRVFREHATITLPELRLTGVLNEKSAYVTLVLTPLQEEGSATELVLITIEDVAEQVRTRVELEAAQAEHKQLADDLVSVNKLLSDVNKELVATNEALQATNEEMMFTQEELQATNEEFEATNEEMSATNEELETSNEELQATNEELETTNDELHSRTRDLEELTKTLANERVRLTETVALAPFSIVVLQGSNLLIEAFNPSHAELFGERDVVGSPFDEAFADKRFHELASLVHEAYRRDTVKVTPRLMLSLPGEEGHTGKPFVYTIVPTHDVGGKVTGAILYAEDVSAQVQREDEESREQLKLMVESADQVALGLYDAATGELLQASPRYLDLLARVPGPAQVNPNSAAIGRTWSEMAFLTESAGKDELFGRVLSSKSTVRLPEVRFHLGDGQETVWDCSFTPIPFRDGGHDIEIRYVLVSAAEVSQQVHARDEMQRLDALKDLFLSSASHELRTPLVPLVGYSDLLARIVGRKENEEDPKWDPRVNEYVAKIRAQLSQMTRLVNDLFDVARVESDKLTIIREPLDLRSVMQSAVEEARMSSGGRKVKLDVQDGGKSIMVVGDEVRLTQVMNNLLQNAIKYTPDEGEIDVCLSRREEEGQEKAVIEVQDYGVGISSAELPSIFTRFYQAQRNGRSATGGLGLGLFISKAIVEQHGGTISAQSVEGEGSTFTVVLPVADETS